MTWQDEVVDLHAFFERWYRGEVDPDEIATLDEALDADFTLVAPDGTELSRQALLDLVTASHGARDMKMEIKPREEIAITDDLVAARYEEWHDGERGRVSTVVFRRQGNELRWLTVHETWL